MTTQSLLIDGQHRPASDGALMDVINPATEEVIAQVPSATDADVDAAVASARAALDGPWARLSARERGRILWKLGDLLMARVDEIARLETLHNGNMARRSP
jgi:acyl-CoA reductase-like NAD-dependent aldehyde dehydrogenase